MSFKQPHAGAHTNYAHSSTACKGEAKGRRDRGTGKQGGRVGVTWGYGRQLVSCFAAGCSLYATVLKDTLCDQAKAVKPF